MVLKNREDCMSGAAVGVRIHGGAHASRACLLSKRGSGQMRKGNVEPSRALTFRGPDKLNIGYRTK